MKRILMPFAWLYGIITSFRNGLYDRGILKSYQSHIFSVCIGNLQVGGTGKTPHTAWLYNWLSKNLKVAILSRGYGRKTRGLIEASTAATPYTIGDEPFWYYHTLPQATVVVAEKRILGLQYLEKQFKKPNVILLDDAFQHRAVRCHLNIILSEYGRLYTDDKMLPQGRLREWKIGEKRAEIIIVSKCPENLTLAQKIDLIHTINPFDYQGVFFTTLKPSVPYCLNGNSTFSAKNYSLIMALSGIANNDSFIGLCKTLHSNIIPIPFADHYSYTPNDIKQIVEKIPADAIILTTEKDAVKLNMPELKTLLPQDRVFVLPIVPLFLFNEEEKFKQVVMQSYRKSKVQ